MQNEIPETSRLEMPERSSRRHSIQGSIKPEFEKSPQNSRRQSMQSEILEASPKNSPKSCPKSSRRQSLHSEKLEASPKNSPKSPKKIKKIYVMMVKGQLYKV